MTAEHAGRWTSASGSLLAIAHRAGNSPSGLRRARDLGADVIEADVHLYRDRLEVRHLKTMGPLPWLWDQWELRSARTPRLHLSELLAAADGHGDALGSDVPDGDAPNGDAPNGDVPDGDARSDDVTLMLDLKGRDAAVGHAVVAALGDRREMGGDHPEMGPVLVCSRHWPALEPFTAIPWARVIRSARTVAELAPLLTEPVPVLSGDPGGRSSHAGRRQYGVSVHRSLLRPDIVAALHQRVEVVMTWPVNDAAALAEVRGYAESGTIGVISDESAVLRQVLAMR